MRYLAAALIAEGSSDDRFLPPLLTRALEDLCVSEFIDSVEVADVQVLRGHTGPHTVEETYELLLRNAGSFSLMLFHRDQDSRRPDQVRREWCAPLEERWKSRPEPLVMVVPVRKTEAWMLADGQALRKVLGVRWTDPELGVPRSPALVEQIEEPKGVLRALGDRTGRPVQGYLDRLGGLIRLDVLTAVPAFALWRADTARALSELGFRRRS